MAGIAWIVQRQTAGAGWMLLAAGIANLVRSLGWYGWGVMSLLIVGGSILALGLQEVDAVHPVMAGGGGGDEPRGSIKAWFEKA